jgi:hypothetical protein
VPGILVREEGRLALPGGSTLPVQIRRAPVVDRAPAASPGPHSPGPSLPASLPPAGREGRLQQSWNRQPLVAGPPSSPCGWGGGGEKRAGVMRANRPGAPTLTRPSRPAPPTSRDEIPVVESTE